MTGALAELTARVRFELGCLGYPAREWVPPRTLAGRPVLDVAIVGGGQSGMSIAFRLMRDRVTNVRVFDRNAAGFEGPWTTFARMRTLRTPKDVTGPDTGVPSLSVRAWWEARHGARSWNELERIPREEWQTYLQWVRAVIGLDVCNTAEVVDIEPIDASLFVLRVRSGDTIEEVYARTIVLANGIEGTGVWTVPAIVEASLPRRLYAHTSEPIDFAALAGKRVAIIGAGASAFDNAATALEAGAQSADLFVRRAKLPDVNPYRWMEFAGFLRHFGDLDDARKWRAMRYIFNLNQPPPQDTFDRCARFDAFRIHLDSAIVSASVAGERIHLVTTHAAGEFDFLILGTGFAVDVMRRPELARFADAIALWGDRYAPPPGNEHAALARYPYLSDAFAFTEKVPHAAPFLRHVFCYTFAAMPSFANSAGISQLKFGVERLAAGVTRALFLADADVHLDSLYAYAETELSVPDGVLFASARPHEVGN